MIFQAAVRSWPPAAVHDTVAAVVRSADFRRSLQMSLAERLLRWLGEAFDRLDSALRGWHSARSVAIGLGMLLVLLVVGRLLLAARGRRGGSEWGDDSRGTAAREDPWGAAERYVRAGRFEEAAHALYRAVLESLAHGERLRLDPSKTGGDYARELRARGSPSFPPFRAFLARFDVAIFGHGGCTAESMAELTRLAEPFRPRRGVRAA